MIKDKKCPLCNSAQVHLIESISADSINKAYKNNFRINNAVSADYFNYCQCDICKLLFFNPMETGGEGFYEMLQEFDWYYMAEKYEYSIAKKHLLKTGNLLEIGAGNAAFSVFSGVENYTGLEFNQKAISSALKKGIKLLKQSIEEHASTGCLYDTVVTFQVLEHVKNPKEFISGCIKCLKPGGRLIISVPSLYGFAGKALNNILNMPPHHVTHWAIDTFEKIAEINNLKILSIEYEPVALYHRSWAKKSILENKFRKIMRMETSLLDMSFKSNLISRAAHLLGIILPIRLDNILGHTVVIVYEKKLLY
ncbi:MAG: hypothetical protein CTY18_01835 [Methylomonas sp.]|nr:MAG: hypothetical protein CTY18_01835 [Methylomonas sp.]